MSLFVHDNMITSRPSYYPLTPFHYVATQILQLFVFKFIIMPILFTSPVFTRDTRHISVGAIGKDQMMPSCVFWDLDGFCPPVLSFPFKAANGDVAYSKCSEKGKWQLGMLLGSRFTGSKKGRQNYLFSTKKKSHKLSISIKYLLFNYYWSKVNKKIQKIKEEGYSAHRCA